MCLKKTFKIANQVLNENWLWKPTHNETLKVRLLSFSSLFFPFKHKIHATIEISLIFFWFVIINSCIKHHHHWIFAFFFIYSKARFQKIFFRMLAHKPYFIRSGKIKRTPTVLLEFFYIGFWPYLYPIVRILFFP